MAIMFKAQSIILFAGFICHQIHSFADCYKIPRGILPGDDPEEKYLTVEEDKSWPSFSELGQVSAVAFDKEGNLHVFHRGSRIWDESTFDENNRLRNRDDGPIANDTILVINPKDGKIKRSWGSGKFYLPHGLTIDHENNTWVTDVGMHQVMKFPPGKSDPSLVIGEAFQPGAGPRHLCQPSDVAVLKSGYFFISDGYCNSRILMFSPGGRIIEEIGADDGMRVPHSLSLLSDYGAVCVADRENRRILCYSTGTDGNKVGEPLAEFGGRGLGRVYGIGRSGDHLFALNGPDGGYSPASSHGVSVDIDSGAVGSMWGPHKGFSGPHDLAISPDGKDIYVAELDPDAPKKIYKFKIND